MMVREEVEVVALRDANAVGNPTQAHFPKPLDKGSRSSIDDAR